MTPYTLPLLADGWADLIGSAAPIVLGLLYVVFRWVVGQAGGAPKGGARPPNVPPPPAQGGRPPNPLAEIEEFLRRAAALQGEKARPAAQPPPAQRPQVQRPPVQPAAARRPPPVPGTPAGAEQRPRKRAGKVRPAGALRGEQPVEVELAKGGRRPEGVAEHVKQHLDSRPLRERAAQLTHLDQTDEQMQSHVQQSLGGTVGRLGSAGSDRPEAATAQSTTTASAAALYLAGLLRDPASMRTAIILQEVLRRPEQNW